MAWSEQKIRRGKKHSTPLFAKIISHTVNIDGSEYVKFSEMEKIRDKLNRVKSEMDTMDQEILRDKLRFVDPFSSTHKLIEQKFGAENVSNAWIKMWEILMAFDFFPDKSRTYKIFCNAEFPGAFIFSLNHYLATKKISYEWTGSSLYIEGMDKKNNSGSSIYFDKSDKNFLGDKYGLFTKCRQNWLMDKDEMNGDVTVPSNRKKIFAVMGNKCDLYTSDLGFEVKDYNRQEELHYDAHTGAAICGITSLRVGGSMVLKYFTFFDPRTIQLWQKSIFPLFRENFVFKPAASRAANSEVYLICRDLIREISFEEGEKLMEFTAQKSPDVNIMLYKAAETINGAQITALETAYIVNLKEKKAVANINKLGISPLPTSQRLATKCGK